MLGSFRETLDLLLRFFCLGLFLMILVNWLQTGPERTWQRRVNGFYDLFLNPLRRYVKPIGLFPSAPVKVDLTPMVLLLMVWWLIHPFLMWVFGG